MPKPNELLLKPLISVDHHINFSVYLSSSSDSIEMNTCIDAHMHSLSALTTDVLWSFINSCKIVFSKTCLLFSQETVLFQLTHGHKDTWASVYMIWKWLQAFDSWLDRDKGIRLLHVLMWIVILGSNDRSKMTSLKHCLEVYYTGEVTKGIINKHHVKLFGSSACTTFLTYPNTLRSTINIAHFTSHN